MRVLHWINAICLAIMFMSGLQIFNAHPALYWGRYSDFDHPALWLTAEQDAQGHLKGITQIGTASFNTTGWLGASRSRRADDRARLSVMGHPARSAMARHGPALAFLLRLDFRAQWLVCLRAYAFWSRHFAARPVADDADLRHLGQEIVDHLRLRFPKGEAAKRYNALQKIAYFSVMFILGPLVVLTGLTMSPTMDSVFPFLLVGVRRTASARTIHFICAFSFLGFFIIHIVMVSLWQDPGTKSAR